MRDFLFGFTAGILFVLFVFAWSAPRAEPAPAPGLYKPDLILRHARAGNFSARA